MKVTFLYSQSLKRKLSLWVLWQDCAGSILFQTLWLTCFSVKNTVNNQRKANTRRKGNFTSL